MQITRTENKFLNSLVQDCIVYRLTSEEALSYIETRFKRVSEACYKHRKARVQSEQSTQLWLNHFTRIGFIQHHKEQVDAIQMIQRDSIKQFHIETQRNKRDEAKINILKHDIKENAKLLSELGLGTPIISAVKARIERVGNSSVTGENETSEEN